MNNNAYGTLNDNVRETTNDNVVEKEVSGNRFISTRCFMLILLCFGMINVYALRVNLNLAIVTMAKKVSKVSADHECIDNNPKMISNSTNLEAEHEFDWDSRLQGQVIGSFFYGYFITNILGGRFSEMFGAKWIFGVSVFGTAATSFLIPAAARYSVYALIILRVIQGLLEGMSFPAAHTIVSRWFPKNERGFAVSLCYSGSRMGPVIAMPLVGYLCQSNIWGGWPAAFYIFAIIGCVWFLFWVIFYHETPSDHPMISKKELSYILSQQGDEVAHQRTNVPWCSILCSFRVWVIVFTEFTESWGFNVAFSEFPSYMYHILNFDVQSSGILMAFPYLFQVIVNCISGYTADLLLSKNILSRTNVRKLFTCLGLFLPALCAIGIIYSGCNKTASLAMFILFVGLIGLASPGYRVSIIDMSPDFAGTICGITNGISNMSGFLVPITVGAITNKAPNLAGWAEVFWISSGTYIFGGILFLIGSSSELQSWGLSRNP